MKIIKFSLSIYALLLPILPAVTLLNKGETRSQQTSSVEYLTSIQS